MVKPEISDIIVFLIKFAKVRVVKVMAKTKIAAAAILFVAVAVFVLGVSQFLTLRKAHSSFENYYAFRGCSQLIDKSDDWGVCRTKTGETIKVVKYQNKWYLDGDLPWGCFKGICFGW